MTEAGYVALDVDRSAVRAHHISDHSQAKRCTGFIGRLQLFIATLAFGGATLLDSAKVGILSGSIVSGVVGAMILRRGTRSA